MENAGMDLAEVRKHLDRIDSALVLLLAERVSLIPYVANYKKENNIVRLQPEREKQILEAKKNLAIQNNVNPEVVDKIFKILIEESHRIEKEIMGE